MGFSSSFSSNVVTRLYWGGTALFLVVLAFATFYVLDQQTAAFESDLENVHQLQTDKLVQLNEELRFQSDMVLTLLGTDEKLLALLRRLPGDNSEYDAKVQADIYRQIQVVLHQYSQRLSYNAVTNLKIVLPGSTALQIETAQGQIVAVSADQLPPFVVESQPATKSALSLEKNGIVLKSGLALVENNRVLAHLELDLNLKAMAAERQNWHNFSQVFAQMAILVRSASLNKMADASAETWFRFTNWATMHPNILLHDWIDQELIKDGAQASYLLIQQQDKRYLISMMPWPLWHQQASNNDAVSVQWQDVTALYNEYVATQKYIVSIVLLTVLLLITLSWFAIKFLQRIATRDIAFQESLRKKTENNLAILFRLSPLPILLNRLSDGTYVNVNPAMEQLVGYTLDELKQMSFRDLTPDFYAGSDLQRRAALLETGSYGPHVKQYRHKNGQRIDIEVNGVLFTDERTDEKFIWTIIKDISELKRVEKLKDDFVSTISHELRTPLTSISGALGLVLGGAAGQIDDKAEKLLSIAHKNSQRLNLLINDLLDFEKLVAGKMRFEPAITELRQLLEDAIEQHQPMAKQMAKTLCLGNITKARLWVDPDRIAQVLSNYISNALKFSPEHGTVLVGADIGDNSVKIWVKDSGPGISNIDQKKLFTRFTQLESSKDTKGGTGLGLAISREIAIRSGGDVGVTSQLGEGATFWLQLPLYEDISGIAADGRILVIEDDKETALILCEFLRAQHFDVVWAKNIDEAKLALAGGDICAVTLDLKLEGENGADFFLYLRNDTKTVNLPVLVVSAHVQRGKLKLSALSHAVDWLEKPVDPSLLLLKLNRLITSRGDTAKINRILHIEDDEDIKTIIGIELGQYFDYVPVSSVSGARALLAKTSFDLVILDLGLPDGDGADLLADIQLSQGDIPIVIFSARDMTLEPNYLVQAQYSKTKISTDSLARNLKAILKC